MSISYNIVSWIILNIHFSLFWKMTQQILHSSGNILLLYYSDFLMSKSSHFKWFVCFIYMTLKCFLKEKRCNRKSRSYFHLNDRVKRGSKSLHFAKVRKLNCSRFGMKTQDCGGLLWPLYCLLGSLWSSKPFTNMYHRQV